MREICARLAGRMKPILTFERWAAERLPVDRKPLFHPGGRFCRGSAIALPCGESTVFRKLAMCCESATSYAMSLERFHQAQARKWAGYATALAEIRNGRKRGHWIWYIFPQLDGLGRSSTARSYSLRDLDEACAYLRDPLLGPRYEEITAAVAERLANGASVEDLMGGSTDALKLVSSPLSCAPPPRSSSRLKPHQISPGWRSSAIPSSVEPPPKVTRPADSPSQGVPTHRALE